jgi:cytochrome o ubiquinol oxidase subunit 1
MVGFCLSFIPMYILGFMGASRRLDHYDASTGWQPLFVLMLIGGIVIGIGVALQLAQILASFIQKKRVGNDPWEGRTLEWSVASPPQSYNYTVIPEVTTRDAFWEMKQHDLPEPAYEDIETPKNTATGIYIAAFGTLACFGFVWNIIWMIVVSFIGIIVTLVVRGFNEHSEYTVAASDVRKLEEAREEKDRAVRPLKDNAEDEDLGLLELIRIVLKFVISVIRQGKRWRAS